MILIFSLFLLTSLGVLCKQQVTHEAEKNFFGAAPSNCNGPVLVDPTNISNSMVHLYDDATIIFTVNIPRDDAYPVALNYALVEQPKSYYNPSPVVNIKANGHDLKTVSLPHSDSRYTVVHVLQLREGLNTISYKSIKSSIPTGLTCSSILVDSITIYGGIPLAAKGATPTYVEMEAEDANYVGTLVGPSRIYGTIASEASGRKAVLLSKSGDYVEFTLTKPANAFVLRFSIPDSADGSGITAQISIIVDGKSFATINVTSRYSWTYGHYPFTKNPGDGNAHHFFDDVRNLLNTTLPAGTKFRLVGESTSVPYHIDLVDFYLVPAPYSPPANFLSVIDFGADPTGKQDSWYAFSSGALSAGKQNRPLWVPQGNYHLGQRFQIQNGVTIRGAGPWYTSLNGYEVGVYGQWGTGGAQNVGLYDFAIIGETRVRNDYEADSGIGAGYSNAIIQNIWIEHTKVGMWLDGPFTQLLITGVTIRNTLADGINFHTGATNCTVEQSYIRNTADDGLAMWSQFTPDQSNIFKFNTIQVPILANAIAIYGGSDNSVTDNMVYDSVTMGGGIHVGNRFNAIPLGGVTTIARNTVTRCGAKDDWFNSIGSSSNTFGGIFFWANDEAQTGTTNVVDCQIVDSSYEAIGFSGSTVSGVTFNNITIDGATYAVREDSNGGAMFNSVVAKNLQMGGQLNCGKQFSVTQGSGNSGWSDVHCPST